MSDSVRPHRWQPTRLPRPWDSPGKNTGVGCHFLLQCMKVKSKSEVAQSCLTLSDPMDCSLPGSSVHGIFQARVLEWSAIAFSHSVSCRWIKPWILSLGNRFYLYYQWEEWINKITVGEDKKCTSQKMVKLRRQQGKRMRETTEIPWRY